MKPEQLASNILAKCPDVLAKIKTEAARDGTDLRKITSPQNGQRGGRVFIHPDRLAEDFLRERYTRDGFLTLRRYCGTWYEWRGGYWRSRADGDIRAAVSGYLQNVGIGDVARLSRRTVDDVLAMLDADNLCALDSLTYHIPCFLPGGESAAGWMPMKNVVVNIEEAAAAMEQGDPMPPQAMRQPSPDMFITYGLNYDFDPTAQCPKFLKYLAEVQPSEENRECLQMLAGLALVPDCRYNVFFILVGAPGTGKSVFCDVLTALVGRVNVSEIEFARFGDRFGLRPLTEKLLNFDRDVKLIAESGSNSGAEGVLKKATQGEPIIVEDKGVNPYSAGGTARLIFACNDLPYIADKGAVFDRVRIIPFNQRIRGTEKQNPNLAAEIVAAELPGILNWALVGLAKLRKLTQFPDCTEGAALKDEHRTACDHEREFLTEFVEEAAGHWESSNQLFKKYQAWMLENGYRPTGAANFKKAVKRIFPKSREERKRIDGRQLTVFYNIHEISNLG